jgi:2-dehydro-3-deoxygalactonokinase
MNTPLLRPLIAIDWGTSSLRGARFDRQGQRLEERHFPRGILTVAPGEFPAVFEACFGDWMQDSSALCLLSGMVGSRQGWQEAPYCPCPAGFAEIGQHLLWLQPGRLAIVPGLSVQHHDGLPADFPIAQHDVMRGEEIQIFGALTLAGVPDATVVLPGTHSKWARVEQGRVTGFRSFMTGEVYALLSQHSILSRTWVADAPWHEDTFRQAVRLAQHSPSVLSSIFATRTLALFDTLPAVQHPSFLSGLLIGEELRAMQTLSHGVLLLVGSATLTLRYQCALQTLGLNARGFGDEATWAGHLALARHL